MSGEFNEAGYFLDLAVLIPLLLGFFRLVRGELARKVALIATGIYLVSLISPRLALFFIAYWTVAWLGSWAVHRASRGKTALFVAALLALLAPMVAWKLGHDAFVFRLNLVTHHLLWTGWRRLGEIDAIRATLLPVGLSWSSFRAVDLLIQVYLGLPRRPSLADVLHYGFFPPLLVIGPISEYSEVQPASSAPAAQLSLGLQRIVLGLCKLYLLAAPLAFAARRIAGFESGSASGLWIALFWFAWYFYFNFAGYSDLAIGFAEILGYRLKDNFHHPFFQSSLREFWASWHISLTRFVQRNIFVPLGGFRRSRQYPALFATMMTIALWHDVSWALVAFGGYHAAGLMLERFAGQRLHLPRPLSVPATFCFVMLSFPMLLLPGERLAHFYLKLLGAP